jgi:hypothetical protein
VPLIASLHFTPDGASGRRHVITINIALLAEGAIASWRRAHNQVRLWLKSSGDNFQHQQPQPTRKDQHKGSIL